MGSQVSTLPLSTRTLTATEARLEAVYAAARKGLRGDNLAMAASMTPVEYQRLRQLDPLVELAELKGRADSEMELVSVLHDAALAGDAKIALEILKHRHDWVAKQQVQVDVSQQISIRAALEQAHERVVQGVATRLEAPHEVAAPDLRVPSDRVVHQHGG